MPFLILAAIGLFFTLKEKFRQNPVSFHLSLPSIAVGAILLIAMGSNMNLGIRQILSLYPLLAVAGGYGASSLLRSFKKGELLGPALVMLLFAWQLISSFGAHPDYLAYFNELAGDHPEKIIVDSDLDWGQDLKRLAQTLKTRGIKEISISYHGSDDINLDLFDLPSWKSLQRYQKVTGWVAISMTSLKTGTAQGHFSHFDWLQEYEPIERIGKSILLYYIP